MKSRAARRILYIVVAIALLTMFGCRDRQESAPGGNRTEISRATTAPPLPVPEADEILIVSKRKFTLVETATSGTEGPIGYNGEMYFLVEDAANFSTRHLQKHGDPCYYRPQQTAAGTTVACTATCAGASARLIRCLKAIPM